MQTTRARLVRAKNLFIVDVVEDNFPMFTSKTIEDRMIKLVCETSFYGDCQWWGESIDEAN